jgi:hypothetical protein
MSRKIFLAILHCFREDRHDNESPIMRKLDAGVQVKYIDKRAAVRLLKDGSIEAGTIGGQ